MEYKADLHVHSYGTREEIYLRSLKIEKIVDKAFEEKLGILCIANMNAESDVDFLLANPKHLHGCSVYDLDGRGVVIERDSEKLFLLRGIEYFHHQGHIMSVGHKKKVEVDLYGSSICNVVDEIKEAGGLAIPAHILNVESGGISKSVFHKIKYVVDAVEGFNSQNVLHLKKYNQLAEKLAIQCNVPYLSTSDAHRVNQIGLATVTFSNLDVSSGDNLIRDIREKLKGHEYDHSDQQSISIFGFIGTYFVSRMQSPRDFFNIAKFTARYFRDYVKKSKK